MFTWRKLRTSTMMSYLLAATVACLGCNGAKPLYPVQAKIFYDGQPAIGALVVLHPVDDTSLAAIRPSGYVDETGGVKLTSYISSNRSAGDGAPAGDHIVSIAWMPVDVTESLSSDPTAELRD